MSMKEYKKLAKKLFKLFPEAMYSVLDEDGLMKLYKIEPSCGNTYWVSCRDSIIASICQDKEFNINWKDSLLSREEVMKKRWKPKRGEAYYFPHFSSPSKFDCDNWVDDIVENYLFENGMIFKTRQEAINATNKMLEAVK